MGKGWLGAGGGGRRVKCILHCVFWDISGRQPPFSLRICGNMEMLPCFPVQNEQLSCIFYTSASPSVHTRHKTIEFDTIAGLAFSLETVGPRERSDTFPCESYNSPQLSMRVAPTIACPTKSQDFGCPRPLPKAMRSKHSCARGKIKVTELEGGTP